ncbi:2-dehydro-3-deoxyphosphooctonate aldolase [Flavobacterium sp.]|uniref:2-dehydro-3-deoxyphosphooctonate aldolase n=1 Tax=Flavobacterium sp. TaxID=239 RepID=UPI0028BD536F|nr:2-dehydro-3-deoxyphosphooctonate aldolase [Flavobacterium sp.]
MLKKFSLLVIFIGLTSCISTKSTIKNIDETAIKPVIKSNAYQITEYAQDAKYGYDSDYPINIGFIMEMSEQKFIAYYFNGLQAPNGEMLTYKKTGDCCPFPTKNNKMGGGTLSIYEVTWEGNKKPIQLHFNIYERGKIVCPKGLSIKKTVATKS